jgi:xylulokinase
MSLIGIDVGTTGCKAVVFDERGKQLAVAYREYPVHSPKPGWLELDPRRVLQDVRDSVKEAAQKAGDPVQALAVSSQGEAIVPIGKGGEILANSIVSSCPRTSDLVPVWEKRFGRGEIFKKTGIPVASCYTPLRLEWLKENDPETFQRIEKVLFFEDFVYWGLGLEPAVDYSLVSRSMCLDLESKVYWKEAFASIDFDPSRFSRPDPSGTVVGQVGEKAAQEWGLPIGTTVVTGGHDQPAAALGVGAIEEGVACYGLGTVECVTSVFDKPMLSSEMLDRNLCCYYHTFPGKFVSLAYNFTGGSLFKWYRDTFGGAEVAEATRTGRDVYDLLSSKVPTDPTRLFVLPHFTSTGTPYFDNHSRGAMVGLTLGTSEGEVIKSILEGITYEIRMCSDTFHEVGHPVKEFRCSGGGAKSPVWMQIKADIMNAEMTVPEVSEAGCLGMALLAGSAVGVYHDLKEAVEATVKVTRRYEPDAQRAARYDENMAVYRDLYPAMREINHRIARL